MRIDQHKIEPFDETAVIVYSEEDRAWIAHGLRTDQIGIGNRIVEALADLLKAIDQICETASHDESLAYLREAPPEIQKRAERAKMLPKEMYEVAHKMARGEWPNYVDPDFKMSEKGEAYAAQVPAEPCPV